MKYMPVGLVPELVALLTAVALSTGGAAAHPALWGDCSLACLWECSSRLSTRSQILLR
jgi:hypothetical protein